MRFFVFTHIPRTSGTTMVRSLFRPTFAPDEVSTGQGLRSLLTWDWSGLRLMRGHNAYGVHRLMRRRYPVYFTMLRDPFEQALSYYYFLRTTKSDTYEHPFYPDAARNSLVDFYALSKYQNIQTRYLAGMTWNWLRDFAISRPLDPLILHVAKRHLTHRYDSFGLTERFDESMRMFARAYGWTYRERGDRSSERYNSTSQRPSSSQLTESQRTSLRRLNHLDFELYGFAQQYFERQRHYGQAFDL